MAATSAVKQQGGVAAVTAVPAMLADSGVVRGRRPFARDPVLDYDDAESDDSKAGDAEEEEDAEGFLVEDGFLSDDEGVRLEEGLWCWELREPRKALLGPGQTQAAKGSSAVSNRRLLECFRKRRKELHERLVVASGLLDLLHKSGVGALGGGAADNVAKASKAGMKALEAKIVKAAQKMEKLPSLAQAP
ncbi:uncharacterized protein HaLaN_23993 [Haematococcus lacustris]|uniref:Uncharacterized protein n=1 Tax=Haematococcus lacustris TaxID=44745 RepID=A0A6A0A0U2_HAELA|nr:uncharacterized protein HaLaN_23993 [Haematococcus lacustris]